MCFKDEDFQSDVCFFCCLERLLVVDYLFLSNRNRRIVHSVIIWYVETFVVLCEVKFSVCFCYVFDNQIYVCFVYMLKFSLMGNLYAKNVLFMIFFDFFCTIYWKNLYICNVNTVTPYWIRQRDVSMCQGMPSESAAVPAAVALRMKHVHCLSCRIFPFCGYR